MALLKFCADCPNATSELATWNVVRMFFCLAAISFEAASSISCCFILDCAARLSPANFRPPIAPGTPLTPAATPPPAADILPTILLSKLPLIFSSVH